MPAAATTADLPPPSRSGRLLSLVRSLIEYDKADDPFPTQPSQNRILNAVIYGR
jgi:hypothetical protein